MSAGGASSRYAAGRRVRVRRACSATATRTAPPARARRSTRSSPTCAPAWPTGASPPVVPHQPDRRVLPPTASTYGRAVAVSRDAHRGRAARRSPAQPVRAAGAARRRWRTLAAPDHRTPRQHMDRERQAAGHAAVCARSTRAGRRCGARASAPSCCSGCGRWSRSSRPHDARGARRGAPARGDRRPRARHALAQVLQQRDPRSLPARRRQHRAGARGPLRDSFVPAARAATASTWWPAPTSTPTAAPPSSSAVAWSGPPVAVCPPGHAERSPALLQAPRCRARAR